MSKDKKVNIAVAFVTYYSIQVDRVVDFGAPVECMAENKVGSFYTNTTIPGA
jgi:hypothetical protein